eukprot:6468493-Amphidinium_carterae.1
MSPIVVAVLYGYLGDNERLASVAKSETRSMLRELSVFLGGLRRHGVCVMGDFNLDDADPVLDWMRFSAEWYHGINDYHLTVGVATCHTAKADTAIDHVLVNDNLWRLVSGAS